MNQKKKVALVTGAASGIGRATAIKLAQNGAMVAVTDVNEKMGQETVSLIEEAGGAAKFYLLDVADKQAVKDTIVQIIKDFGPIKLAVNNAGIGGVLAPTHQVQDADWDRMMQINLSGVFYCMREEIDSMLHHGGGAIVNISSLAGLNGFGGNAPYSAAKHAVIGLTKSAAQEYGALGIRVNAVCPGFTQTAIISEAGEMVEKVVQNRVPMKRIGQPEEVANTIVWLLSEEASYINGNSMQIDGGMQA